MRQSHGPQQKEGGREEKRRSRVKGLVQAVGCAE